MNHIPSWLNLATLESPFHQALLVFVRCWAVAIDTNQHKKNAGQWSHSRCKGGPYPLALHLIMSNSSIAPLSNQLTMSWYK